MQESTPSDHPTWSSRIGWLAALWLAGVLVLGAVAMAFRLLMNAAGLTT